MFYSAEFHSEGRALSVNGFALQLLVSSVFAWQAVIQSIRCCTLGLPRASSHGLARRHAYGCWFLKFETGWSGVKYLGLVLMLHSYGQLWSEVSFWWKVNIKNGCFDLCFLNSYVSACQMGVFYSGWKSRSVRPRPAPGLFDRHTAILTKCDSPFPNLPLWNNPKWMAIGFIFCSVVVKPPVNWKIKRDEHLKPLRCCRERTKIYKNEIF